MEQIWVRKDASLEKKVAPQSVVFTKEMKDEIKALDEITVQKVKSIVQGSSSDARNAIEELVNAKEIKTKQDRYAELFPSADVVDIESIEK